MIAPRHLLLAAFATTLLLGLLPPTSASAGSYTIWSCRGPDGAPAATDAWVPYGGTTTLTSSRVDTCAAGGALSVMLGDSPGDRAASATTGFRLQLPTTVSTLSYRVEMAGSTSSGMAPPNRYDVGLTRGSEGHEFGIATGHGCNVSASACAFGDLTTPLAPANVVSGTLLGATTLRFKAFCRSGPACIPGPAIPAALGRLFRAAIEIEDDAAPVVGDVAGSVAAAGPLAGTRSVAAAVSDAGGGIHRTALLVDGAVHASRAGVGRCAEPFTAPIPCPDTERAAFDLDTTQLPDGPHTVVVRATDAGGNVTDSGPLNVVVDNRPVPPVVVMVPAPVPTPLPTPLAPPVAPPAVADTASLGGVRLDLPTRRSTSADSRAGGRLTGPDGAPRAGVPVRFERRPFGGDAADWKRVGTTVTDRDGRFTLPRTRESGEVRAVVGDVDDPAASRTVAFVAPLRVGARASDRTLRNGQRFTLQATVSGDGDAFTGREALIQARVSGRWRTVDAVRVAADGRVRWDYRFTSTRTTARYRFRVLLPQVKRLPWKQVHSSVVTVLVRP